MGISIIKTDPRGAYRLVAEHDLYLDKTGQKVIIVRQGEEVPAEAATVLAGKGGTIPTRYAKLVEGLDAPEEAKVKPEPLTPEVVPEPVAEPAPEPEPPKPEPKAKAPKSKPTEEKTIST